MISLISYLDLLQKTNEDEVKNERNKLDKEYESIKHAIQYKVYRYRDFAIYHIIIPSTNKNRENISYDVIIELKTTSLHEGSPKLDKVPMTIFSNCPSFVFGHAYQVHKSGNLCDWLSKKYDKRCLTQEPDEKHLPKFKVERTIYLALLYIHSNNLDDESTYKTVGKKVDSRREIVDSVRSQLEIMNHIKEKIQIDRKQKELDKIKEPKEEESEKNEKPKNGVKTTKSTKTVKSVSKVKSVKKVKTVKNVKKI